MGNIRNKTGGFPKTQRLRKRRDYLKVQRNGARVHLRHLLAFVLPSQGETLRIGITVSSKVGCAVVRNRIKRLLRVAWRMERDHFPLGFDVVVISKKNAVDAHINDLETQMRQLGKRISHGRR